MRMSNCLTFCLINFPLQTHHCRGKRQRQVVILSHSMVYSQDIPRCWIERDGYALCRLYVGHLSMVKLLERFIISSQIMASKYAHGLLFYSIVAC
jgi:hypothetical protein